MVIRSVDVYIFSRNLNLVALLVGSQTILWKICVDYHFINGIQSIGLRLRLIKEGLK